MKAQRHCKTGTDAYKTVDLETAVMNASPHQRIVMLFDGAISAIRRAHIFMQQGKIKEKGNSLSQAISILERLNYRLDFDKGGQYAEDLSTIYNHLCMRLIEANFYNDITILTEALEILQDVADSWKKQTNTLTQSNQDTLNGTR